MKTFDNISVLVFVFVLGFFTYSALNGSEVAAAVVSFIGITLLAGCGIRLIVMAFVWMKNHIQITIK